LPQTLRRIVYLAIFHYPVPAKLPTDTAHLRFNCILQWLLLSLTHCCTSICIITSSAGGRHNMSPLPVSCNT